MINPAERACFRICRACYRCGQKGSRAQCQTCSGRVDPALRRDPYDFDDRCRCTEGILQIRVRGKLLRARYQQDPFQGKLVADVPTQDETDWNDYVKESREKLDDQHWDPVRFNDGSSTHDWMKAARVG